MLPVERRPGSGAGTRLRCVLTKLAEEDVQCQESSDVLMSLDRLPAEKVRSRKSEIVEAVARRLPRMFPSLGIDASEMFSPILLTRLLDQCLKSDEPCCDDCGKSAGKKKACAGCGKKAPAAAAKTGPPLQFVWCYWHNGAKGDELRFSMRSVEHNYHGLARLLVVGDRAPWYDGAMIQEPRVRRGRGFRRGLRDVLHKMKLISEHPDVEDSFVWMMDDVFMVRPTTMEQIQTPRAGRSIGSSRINGWRTVMTETAQRLRDAGLPCLNYATHLPHYVEKKKLQELFEHWDPDTEDFLWEVAYHNFHRHEPHPYVPFLRRLGSARSPEKYDEAADKSHFVNMYASGWRREMKEWLLQRFPERHAGETGDAPAVVRKLPEPIPLDRAICCITSAYHDDADSRLRLEHSRKSVLPSLQQQTRKPELVVMLNAKDPMLTQRKQMYRDTGLDVTFLFRRTAVTRETIETAVTEDFQIPYGPRVAVTRLDDDDILPKDFFELTLECAEQCEWQEAMLQWPNGYVWYRNRLHRYTDHGNQFITLVSNRGLNPKVVNHYQCRYLYPNVTVNPSRGWIWFRHEDTISLRILGEIPGKCLLQSGGRPNRTRWPVKIP